MPGTSEELSERRSWTCLGLAQGRASPRSLGTPEGPPSGPALKASGHLEATSAQGSGTTLRSPLAAVPSSTSLPLPPSSGLAWQRPPTGREGHPRGWGSLPSHPPCRPEQGAPLPTPEFLVLPYQRNRETNPPPGMRLCVPAVKDGPILAPSRQCARSSRDHPSLHSRGGKGHSLHGGGRGEHLTHSKGAGVNGVVGGTIHKSQG